MKSRSPSASIRFMNERRKKAKHVKNVFKDKEGKLKKIKK